MLANVRKFVKDYWGIAQAAEARFGIPAHFIMAQAALETGWGKSVRGNNFFGIKAGGKWNGKTSTFQTKEFTDGRWDNHVLVFRAYDTPAQSFNDYAALISMSPRYAEAMKHRDDYGEFAEAVAAAGYATDPAYADKLRRVMAMVEKARLADG